MAEQNYNPILPKEPQDGFELNYFSTAMGKVEAVRLRYHVNTKWSEIAESKGGANLVDQWQVFVDGYFSGRMEGWSTPLTNNHAGHFVTRAAAVAALSAHFEECAESLETRARELRRKAQLVRAEVTNP